MLAVGLRRVGLGQRPGMDGGDHGSTVVFVQAWPRKSGCVDAGPLAKPDEAVLKSCTQRPWPYLNCVGTPLGNQKIRLVTTDRLTP